MKLTSILSNGIEKPYPVQGGIFREEAIMLLRRFYVQQNDKGRIRSVQLKLPADNPSSRATSKENQGLEDGCSAHS